ncbi:nucleoside 2-deoxyribosyltransferase [Microbacterium sp. EYE_5]|nr:nucleoside 2-deoxyribosyltransferase [Microbacterium sp. EYE_382]MCK6086251.1 nucleoside 2-deoxyribosyltransferase [Microbacterium sp. EYE_384]MCK6124251.1 nucleoside 2-deoxyribosyltransferase [Microbacterium sp. EYE_80]MCK6127160.1 nucleoside 2-deoxyribosyltransferase [Microbacterium sp. EYE_79]MCK6141936.1 nucleoside 2-deoxyribosyltransferase [Microbacterium sp. EYE_39]MCK6218806.1 nucleoside 2-deoxyribosyltransferase [Microbacterium sp. EYE_5]MCK6228436.1 nucleoside 2-deoxyribosyltransf
MPPSTKKPTCFIAMPITTHDDESKLYGDLEHWTHVIEHLFIPAVEAAGFRPIRPTASGTSMIHGRIVKHLAEADMVLCDLSQNNPNVFFELGVRTSLNKPIALVRDEHLIIPFDTAGLNTHAYSSTLDVWTLKNEVAALADHISASEKECAGTNPMWRHFGVAISAAKPSEELTPAEARIELLTDRLGTLEERLDNGVGRAAHAYPVRDSSLSSSLIDVDGVRSVEISRATKSQLQRVKLATVKSEPDDQIMRAGVVANVARELGLAVSVDHTTPELIELRMTPLQRAEHYW